MSQLAHLLAEIEKSSVWLCVPRVDSKTDSREAGKEFQKKVLKCENPAKEVGDFDCFAGVEKDSKKVVFIKFQSKESRDKYL